MHWFCSSDIDIIFILGATASGKSDYAFELAQQLSCEIVSADAYQVYRGMDIGTAKPSKEMRKRIPHHLLDCVDPNEDFDVSQFRDRAIFHIESCLKRDKKVIVVGGTNYYIDTLLEGLYETPKSNKVVSEKWRIWVKKNGSEALWREVQRVDPCSAERLHCHDHYRLIRVLDVFEETGKPLSFFKRSGGLKEKFCYQKIGLLLSSSQLLNKVRRRIQKMIDDGFLLEVEKLLKKNMFKERSFQMALGYQEAKQVLEGSMTMEDFRLFLFNGTKKIIKKQTKWLKKDKDILWISIEK